MLYSYSVIGLYFLLFLSYVFFFSLAAFILRRILNFEASIQHVLSTFLFYVKCYVYTYVLRAPLSSGDLSFSLFNIPSAPVEVTGHVLDLSKRYFRCLTSQWKTILYLRRLPVKGNIIFRELYDRQIELKLVPFNGCVNNKEGVLRK